jgi:hypothetical protein
MIVGRCLIFLFAACSLVHGQAGCGRDRWPVKTLTDLDKERVSLSPVSTSVAKLVGFSAPSRPYPQNNRIGPQEFVVYRVRARLLITLLHPSDSDLHLLLADPDTLTAQMIAEIPAPECAEGSGHEDEFRRARAIARKLPECEGSFYPFKAPPTTGASRRRSFGESATRSSFLILPDTLGNLFRLERHSLVESGNPYKPSRIAPAALRSRH